MLGDRRGRGDLVGVESGGGSIHLRAGAGAVRFPYLLFFYFLSFSVWGGWGRDLYNGLASGCKRSDRTVRTLAVL